MYFKLVFHLRRIVPLGEILTLNVINNHHYKHLRYFQAPVWVLNSKFTFIVILF